MQLKENLDLMNTTVTDEAITFDFISTEDDTLYEVKWNLKKYDEDKKAWVEDAGQREKVEKWANEYFDTDIDGLNNLPQGIKKDVYYYGKFNSLWEVAMLSKFPADRAKELFSVTVTNVYRDDFGLKVVFEEDDKNYAVNFSTSKYFKEMNKSFKDASKEIKALEKFEDTFGIPFEKGKALIGQDIMVEIKVAFGDKTYVEAKSLNKKQKEALQEKTESVTELLS